jgi:hypothetical protein
VYSPCSTVAGGLPAHHQYHHVCMRGRSGLHGPEKGTQHMAASLEALQHSWGRSSRWNMWFLGLQHTQTLSLTTEPFAQKYLLKLRRLNFEKADPLTFLIDDLLVARCLPKSIPRAVGKTVSCAGERRSRGLGLELKPYSLHSSLLSWRGLSASHPLNVPS